MTKTHTLGIEFPLMRPLPLQIPEKCSWWNIYGGIKNILVRSQPRSWEIEEDYMLQFPWMDYPVCVPKGFVFDGASVPRVLWPFMSPTGLMFLAGLFHDLGYRYNCWFDENYNPIFVDAGKSFFDSEFEKIGSWVNDATVIPNIAWAGLKVGGRPAWNQRRREGHVALVDFPPKVCIK